MKRHVSSQAFIATTVGIGSFLLPIIAPAIAQTNSPTTLPDPAELLRRIDTLEAEVRELRSVQESASQPHVDQHAVDSSVDSSVDAVVEDARRRSSILDADGISAHYTDGRLLIRSADGNFQLHPWLQFQLRNVTTDRQDAKQDGSSSDTQNGFEVRRLKFGADGNIFSPNFTYMTQFSVDRKSGDTDLEMAWAKYHFGNTPFAIRAGQFKDPLDHEQLEASRNFAPIERTIVDDTFANGEGFIQGVSLLYEPADKNVRGEVAFTDGLRNFNNNFEDYPTAGNSADYGAAGRFEYKVFGRWRDYDKLAGLGTKDPTLVFGVGADYTEAGHTGSLVHVADAQYVDPSGWLFYGAYLGRFTKDNTVGTFTGDTYDSTARGLVSYAINAHWEPYLEYSYIHFDPATLAADADASVHMITLGTNYYFFGHNAKLQFDVSYLPNGSPITDDGAGVLTDNHSNELIARGQFQLLL